jgi:hypothetical protein
VQQWTDNGGNNQRFILTRNDDGSYKITHKGTNKVLDVEGNSSAAGANVVQWDDNGGNNQRFIFVRNDDGSYKIVHKGTDKVLDVNGNSSAAGANVQQWTDNGGNNQRWILTRDGSSVSSNATVSQATLSTTSSSAAKVSSDLAVYPNPATDYVVLPAGTDYFQIVSQSGKTVLEKRGTVAQRQDIKSLPNGLYQVRVGEKGKISSQRLEVK